MHKQDFATVLEEILRHDPRYDRDAYHFVREGLDFTVKSMKKHQQSTPGHRHVSGQELLDGIRRFALEQFGPMTKTVFDHWGIRRCEDFGEIVFNMVEKGVLGKTEQDSRADFKGGYDFDEAFVKPYRPAPHPKPHRRAHREARPHDRVHENRQPTDSKKLSGGEN